MSAVPGSLQLPEILGRADSTGAVVLTLRVPEDLIYFEGHFPVAPILPGVVQLHWARYFGRTLLGFEGTFSHLEAIKFQHVIPPGHQLTLELKYDRDKHKLYYRYHSATGQHSSGRIVMQG